MMTPTRSLPTKQRNTKLLIFLLSLVFGIVGGGIFFFIMWHLVADTPLVIQLGGVLEVTDKTPWHLSRSAGTVAYLLLSGSTIWGLLLSTKIMKELVPANLSLAMHNYLAWLAIGFTALHGLVLLFDNYYTYTLPNLVIPFTGPYQPGWVGLGIIGFYLMLLTSISFSLRKQLGQKRWRQLHYLTFAAYILATVHGMMAGTDGGNPGMQIMYLSSGLIMFFLTTYRLLT